MKISRIEEESLPNAAIASQRSLFGVTELTPVPLPENKHDQAYHAFLGDLAETLKVKPRNFDSVYPGNFSWDECNE